jgi:hypothetical protein
MAHKLTAEELFALIDFINDPLAQEVAHDHLTDQSEAWEALTEADGAMSAPVRGAVPRRLGRQVCRNEVARSLELAG